MAPTKPDNDGPEAPKAANEPRQPSLLDLDQGFLKVPRRLLQSPAWKSLTPPQRCVALDMLAAAQYQPGEYIFAGQRYPLGIGELIDSEETIAARCGVNREVVRRTIKKLEAWHEMNRRTNHQANQAPQVKTFLNYRRIQESTAEANQEANPQPNHEKTQNPTAKEPYPKQLKQEGSQSKNFNSTELKATLSRESAPHQQLSLPVQRVKGQIEALLDSRLRVTIFGDDETLNIGRAEEERAFTNETFEEWIERDGENEVSRQCDVFIRHQFLYNEKKIRSLYYVAQAWRDGSVLRDLSEWDLDELAEKEDEFLNCIGVFKCD